jgi:cysteine-rich CPCC protein
MPRSTRPENEGGANNVSLNQARANFRTHGVSEARFKPSVRPPLLEEQPWSLADFRPLEAGGTAPSFLKRV